MRSIKHIRDVKKDAEAGGYHINPDEDFARGLVSGLLVNQARTDTSRVPAVWQAARRKKTWICLPM
jgi:ferredoxin-thioredoxin reductase catalytic subunit